MYAQPAELKKKKKNVEKKKVSVEISSFAVRLRSTIFSLDYDSKVRRNISPKKKQKLFLICRKSVRPPRHRTSGLVH